MPDYDGAHFDPPAPVVQAALRRVESGAMLRGVELLLDSGADITLLPQSAVAQIGVAADLAKRYELMGFDGIRSFASGVRVDLLVLGKVFRGLYLVTEDVRHKNLVSGSTNCSSPSTDSGSMSGGIRIR